MFDMVAGGKEEHWYKFYQYYGSFSVVPSCFAHLGADYSKVRFGPLWSTLPTQFALYDDL